MNNIQIVIAGHCRTLIIEGNLVDCTGHTDFAGRVNLLGQRIFIVRIAGKISIRGGTVTDDHIVGRKEVERVRPQTGSTTAITVGAHLDAVVSISCEARQRIRVGSSGNEVGLIIVKTNLPRGGCTILRPAQCSRMGRDIAQREVRGTNTSCATRRRVIECGLGQEVLLGGGNTITQIVFARYRSAAHRLPIPFGEGIIVSWDYSIDADKQIAPIVGVGLVKNNRHNPSDNFQSTLEDDSTGTDKITDSWRRDLSEENPESGIAPIRTGFFGVEAHAGDGGTIHHR